ncbi:MAG: peptidoglycan DD-metalloendopeptidase family protein [Candidatus Sumerlaeia bacterium]|nr:peptidoglycan DD-metalloendopeptidase family protein [Candidatus Sumerlaeia bacterium]
MPSQRVQPFWAVLARIGSVRRLDGIWRRPAVGGGVEVCGVRPCGNKRNDWRGRACIAIAILLLAAHLEAGTVRAASAPPSELQKRRERLADVKRQIAAVQKQISSLNEREKDVQESIAARKKILAQPRRTPDEALGGYDTLAAQIAATSAAIEVQQARRVGLEAQLPALHAFVATQHLVYQTRLRRKPPVEALALHLVALHLESLTSEAATLDESIRRIRGSQMLAAMALEEIRKAGGISKATIEKMGTEIQQLEKELEKVQVERKTAQSRLTLLEKLRKSTESEIASLETAGRKPPSTPAKPSTARAPTPKPKPRVPTAPPAAQPRASTPPGLREGSGLDLLVAEGTEIHALEAGKVLHAGRFMGYGNLVILEHADGVLTLYGFLSEVRVAANTSVARGEVIGRSGFIEDKDRAGLRFEMRQSRSGREVLIDPRSYLPPTVDFQRRLLRGTD